MEIGRARGLVARLPRSRLLVAALSSSGTLALVGAGYAAAGIPVRTE
jgi:hypothetical protein